MKETNLISIIIYPKSKNPKNIGILGFGTIILSRRKKKLEKANQRREYIFILIIVVLKSEKSESRITFLEYRNFLRHKQYENKNALLFCLFSNVALHDMRYN